MELEDNDIKPFCDLVLMISGIIQKGRCFWSNEQSIESLLTCLECECRELFQAVYLKDDKEIISEIGDILGLAVMLCYIASKKEICKPGDPALEQMDKIRRRSPYVFDESFHVASAEEAEALWKSQKATEKEGESLCNVRKITSECSIFALADHVLESGYDHESRCIPDFDSEEDLAKLLYGIFNRAKAKKFNPEHAFRKFLLTQLDSQASSDRKN